MAPGHSAPGPLASYRPTAHSPWTAPGPVCSGSLYDKGVTDNYSCMASGAPPTVPLHQGVPGTQAPLTSPSWAWDGIC